MITGKIVSKYLKRFPNIRKLTLAKKIYKENSLTFTNVEHARSLIRQQTGAKGYQSRRYIRDLQKTNNRYNRLGLPISDETELEPFVIKEKKILVLADIHIPYHSIEALEVALSYGIEEYKPSGILLFGDIIDMYMISRFSQDPNMRSISGELKLLREFFEKLYELFPKIKLYWLFGNHEERWDKFLKRNAPELYDIEEMHLSSMFDDLPIIIIKDKRRVKIGHLDGIHGHELLGGIWSPVNHARSLSLKAKKSTMCGHGHMTSEHPEKRLNGEVYVCWSIGCLCNLQQDYRPYSNINHGFATVDLHNDDSFSFKNYRIFNGRIQ